MTTDAYGRTASIVHAKEDAPTEVDRRPPPSLPPHPPSPRSSRPASRPPRDISAGLLDDPRFIFGAVLQELRENARCWSDMQHISAGTATVFKPTLACAWRATERAAHWLRWRRPQLKRKLFVLLCKLKWGRSRKQHRRQLAIFDPWVAQRPQTEPVSSSLSDLAVSTNQLSMLPAEVALASTPRNRLASLPTSATEENDCVACCRCCMGGSGGGPVSTHTMLPATSDARVAAAETRANAAEARADAAEARANDAEARARSAESELVVLKAARPRPYRRAISCGPFFSFCRQWLRLVLFAWLAGVVCAPNPEAVAAAVTAAVSGGAVVAATAAAAAVAADEDDDDPIAVLEQEEYRQLELENGEVIWWKLSFTGGNWKVTWLSRVTGKGASLRCTLRASTCRTVVSCGLSCRALSRLAASHH